MVETRLQHESGSDERREIAPLARVVVATDFSQGAHWALERARLLPLARGALVELLHVRSPDADATSVDVTAELARLASELAVDARGLRVATRVSVGETHVELIRAARRIDAELVIVGRQGPRTLKERLQGSLVARVLRKGDLPVLVVNAGASQPYRRPLVAVDLVDAARHTIASCLRLLGADVRTLEIVHALHVPFEGLVTPVRSGTSDYHHTFSTRAEACLDELIALFAGSGVEMQRTIRDGDACGVIYESTLAQGADLLAIGTHGRTGLARMMQGSNAELLLDIVPCDVLISRPVRYSFGRD